ncbi:cupin [Glutamicibacter uratoxydans]|uniref:Cupin n=1 Tax=Glutamicibacter uratoxydans TaxID=43667 RepID=A0A4Y4DNR3_GLUUR|nr:cupin domain-containing protein [Glutamicibacter uratoxydans]GED06566.1 cupin [Glutamicibacter uratoxydans]
MSNNSAVFEDPHDTRSIDAMGIDLNLEPVQAGLLVNGNPGTAVQRLGEIFDVEFGLWEMSEGSMRDVEAEELFIVLSGKASVRVEPVNGFEAEEISLVPGSICHLREGMHTTWVVDQPLRKVYLAK